ncbi:MAG TPA: helix-turn-helix domain-containing protein [Lelliottia sp.]
MKNLSIGERIRARRKDLKQTQKSLAKTLQLSDVSVSQWERDDSEPTGKNLFALAKALKCSPTWILFGDEDKTPDDSAVTQPELDDQKLELIELYDALTTTEQAALIEELRARVENANKLFEELLEARKRSRKK